MTKFRNYDLSGQLPVLSWNPIVMRCPGCELSKPDANGWIPCWHIRMCNRMMHNPTIPAEHREIYAGRAPMRMHPKHADEPLGVRKGRVICAQFMGDLGRATPECRADVLRLMKLTPWHKYLVLTKWPEYVTEAVPDNVWLGTTVTDQNTADVRIPALLQVRARHKWVSVEPMLGRVRLDRLTYDELGAHWNVLPMGIGFVACGPQTGPGAVPCDPAWIYDVAEQCLQSNVPFYAKRPDCAEQNDLKNLLGREWPKEWKEAMA